MKKPKRVLLTLDALDRSGVSFALQNLVHGMTEQGLFVMVMAREGGERDQAFRGMKVRVALHRHFGGWIFGRKALAEAKGFRPQIVHAQDLDVARKTYRLAHELDLPLIVTVNRMETEADTAFLRETRDVGVVAVSDAIQEKLTNRDGVDRGRIRVIPNGLDLSQFPCRDHDVALPEGRVPVVGTYGTLIERKGQRVLLQAAAELLQSGQDAEFLILGTGPDKPELRRLAEELGISHRITFNHSTRTDLHSMRNVDIFVEPSHREGLGLSVLQAMACGLPVIASGVGGIFSVVEDGRTGVLVKNGDPAALASAIRDLLRNEAKRHELARNARELVETKFSAAAVAKQLRQFYAERITGASTAERTRV